MWKSLAIAASSILAALGTPVQARDIHLTLGDSEHCGAELNHSVRVGPDFFETRKSREGSEILVRYRSPTQLEINGVPVHLDDRQRQLMEDYRRQLHHAGREILLISLEAVELAADGMSIALTLLAGPDHPNNSKLQRASDKILHRVEERFNREGEIYLLGNPDFGGIMTESVNGELKPEFEKLAMDSAGSIAWHALKAAFTGGRSIDQQAEWAAEEIEPEMEKRAEQLEKRARRLCAQLEAVDRSEVALHQSIPALAAYDIVSLE